MDDLRIAVGVCIDDNRSSHRGQVQSNTVALRTSVHVGTGRTVNNRDRATGGEATQVGSRRTSSAGESQGRASRAGRGVEGAVPVTRVEGAAPVEDDAELTLNIAVVAENEVMALSQDAFRQVENRSRRPRAKVPFKPSLTLRKRRLD